MDISPKRIFQGDTVIWVVFFILCMISLIEVFSAASSLSYKSGDFLSPLFKQARYIAMGTVAAWLMHGIPCRFFKLVPIIGLPLSWVLLVLTLLIGEKENEGARWLSIFGFNFQPSEMAKGVTVIAVALILSRMQREKSADRHAMKSILIVAGITCLLIFPENLSTAVILFGVVFIMMVLGRIPWDQIAKLVGAGIGVLLLVITSICLLPKDTLDKNPLLHRADTWVSRLSSHNTEIKDTAAYVRDNPQESHAFIAIASSNIVGKMPGNSDQRDHLAQAYSDFIFAIIIEEMGIWGAIIVVFLYVILLFRAGRIASRCERNFPAFLTMGLAVLLVSQAMINMLVAVGIAPVTGQPLPLISRGGTSTLITSVYFGIILSVSRYARKTKEETQPVAAVAGTAAPVAEPLPPVEEEAITHEADLQTESISSETESGMPEEPEPKSAE